MIDKEPESRGSKSRLGEGEVHDGVAKRRLQAGIITLPFPRIPDMHR
jgi:hypothetical protein